MSKDKDLERKLQLKMEEYKELGANIRHCGTVHFAQVTVFVVITAGLLAVVFNTGLNLSGAVIKLLEWAGFFVGIAFALILESPIYLWDHYINRAREIEKDLGYKQYTDLVEKKTFKVWARPGRLGVRFLYSGVIVFWIITLFIHD